MNIIDILRHWLWWVIMAGWFGFWSIVILVSYNDLFGSCVLGILAVVGGIIGAQLLVKQLNTEIE